MSRRFSFFAYFLGALVARLGEVDAAALAYRGSDAPAMAAPGDCVGGCNGDQPYLDEYLYSRKVARRLEHVRQQLRGTLRTTEPRDSAFSPANKSRQNPLPEFLVQQLLHQHQERQEQQQPSENTPDTEADAPQKDNTQKKQVIVFPDQGTVCTHILHRLPKAGYARAIPVFLFRVRVSPSFSDFQFRQFPISFSFRGRTDFSSIQIFHFAGV